MSSVYSFWQKGVDFYPKSPGVMQHSSMLRRLPVPAAKSTSNCIVEFEVENQHVLYVLVASSNDILLFL